MTIILAIDPGLTGALALYHPETPHHVGVYDMPVVDGEINYHQLFSLLKTWKPDIAYIERVGPMPRDGVRQAWRFASAYTAARVAVALLNIPTVLVTPGSWKKAMKVGGGADGKEECRAMALRMFPACADHFARKKDAGRAEAALLAVYASQQAMRA
jgi:Holliday junction resolvasome RuvABC endonuclease subunit